MDLYVALPSATSNVERDVQNLKAVSSIVVTLSEIETLSSFLQLEKVFLRAVYFGNELSFDSWERIKEVFVQLQAKCFWNILHFLVPRALA